MTAAPFKATRNILFIAVIACVIFIGGTIALHTVSLRVKDKIADGLLADFVISFPVLYYFIIVRALKVRATSMFLVVSVCCIIAYLVLPQHQRQYILQIRKLTVLAEALFVFYAISKFNKIRAAYKINQLNQPDAIYSLRFAMAEVLGNTVLINVLAAELAVLRYGLLCFKNHKPGLKQSITFSTHKQSGYIAIWCAFLVAVTVEIIAFHVLLTKWSHTAAIIVTALSVYGIVFLVADLSAIVKRRVLISGGQLVLRTGLRWKATTSLSNVSAVTKINNTPPSNAACFNGGVIKSSGNVLITFKQQVVVYKMYGRGKQFSSIIMNIDDLEAFAAMFASANS